MNEAKIQFHGKPGTIPQDLCRAQNITAEAKTIFALLTTYKEAYPGQAWLADHVPCSEPTVRSRLRELELHGWLRRDRRNRRANETDLYHVYLSKPLPISKRAKWVQELGLTAVEVQALPKGDYGKEITVNRLPKRGFPERVEGSEGLKSSDSESGSSTSAEPRRADRTFPPEDYRTIEAAYTRITKIEPQGSEWSPIQQAIKTMFMSGRTPEQIIALMEAFEKSDAEWTANWKMSTVQSKLPEHLAGHLDLSGNGTGPKQPGALQRAGGHDPEIYEQRMRGGKR